MITPTTSQEAPILTVSQLTNAIRMTLEGNFPNIWLQGEISNSKLQSSGHLYFSLKDSQAQIGAVMFRTDVSTLQMPPKDGDNVIVRGEINVYPPSGKYQIIVREMRLVGVGELLLRLEELKKKLLKRGWFKSDHKKPLPKSPKRIGVVTSPTGAVIQDILNILTRRFAGFHLILNPVRVQGDGAAQEIAQAIAQFNQHDLADVLIVGRGGGSIEDLWAFNEEIVAEAIFNSRIPIISAVGHETDHCIADYVADVRAPTPSAAAELVSADKTQQLLHVAQLQKRLYQTLNHLIKQRRHQLEGIKKQPVFVSPYALLGRWMQRVDDMRGELDDRMKQMVIHRRLQLEGRHKQVEALKPSAQIVHCRQKLGQYERAMRNTMAMRLMNARKLLRQKVDRLDQAWGMKYQNRKQIFRQVCSAIASIDPKNLLAKGYCILFAEKEGSVITSVSAVKRDQDIRVMLADGSIISTVKDVRPT